MSFIVSVCILNRLLVVGFNFFFWRYYVRWHLCPNCLNGQRRADNLTFPLVNNAYILTCLCNNTSYLLYLLGSRGSPFFDYRGRFCGKSRWLHQEKERVQIQVPFSASSISRTQRKKVKRFFLFSTAVPLKRKHALFHSQMCRYFRRWLLPHVWLASSFYFTDPVLVKNSFSKLKMRWAMKEMSLNLFKIGEK